MSNIITYVVKCVFKLLGHILCMHICFLYFLLIIFLKVLEMLNTFGGHDFNILAKLFE